MRQLADTLDYEDTKIHRREDCKKYEQCLDMAAIKRWKSFSCSHCLEFEQGTVNVDIFAKQLIEPPIPDRFGMARFSKLLSKRMRARGIPIKPEGVKWGHYEQLKNLKKMQKKESEVYDE